jgi:hypothetical protein
MTPGPALLALLALVPAMTGVPPAVAEARAGVLTAGLCNGGTTLLRLGDRRPVAAATPCCAKGCRTKRRRFDRKQ